jgi:hypothetical protein
MMKIKILFLCYLFIFIALTNLFAQSGEIPVDPKALSNVVKIETFSELKKTMVSGSGFIVSCAIKMRESSGRAIFLVTNKHMLSDWTLADGNISQLNKFIKVHFYSNDPNNVEPVNPIKITLRNVTNNSISEKVETNKNGLIDIAILFLNEDITGKKNIKVPSFDISYPRPFDSITSMYFNIGSQVFVLGYPRGITSLENNLPIAKFGFIASTPGDQFSLKLPAKNRKNEQKSVELIGELLIIDGLIVPGNSGGPVILPSIIKTRIDPETKQWQHMTKPTKNFVIGVLSGSFGQSGLSFSFSSDYVIDTINQFLERRDWEPVDSWP